MKKGSWWMHADELGVYSLLRIDKVKHDVVHYTIHSREAGYMPQNWGAHLPTLMSFNPTRVPAKTARNLLKLLQRKLP